MPTLENLNVNAIDFQPITAPSVTRNDPRLLQQSPGVVAISNTLEKRQRVSNSVVCAGAVVATALAAAHRAEAGIKIASIAFVLHVLFAAVLICKCGFSLIRTINGSLQNHDAVEVRGRGVGQDLLVAKKKIQIAIAFGQVVSVQTMAIVLFAVISKHGSEQALICFGIPMVQHWCTMSSVYYNSHAAVSTKHRVPHLVRPIHSTFFSDFTPSISLDIGCAQDVFSKVLSAVSACSTNCCFFERNKFTHYHWCQ